MYVPYKSTNYLVPYICQGFILNLGLGVKWALPLVNLGHTWSDSNATNFHVETFVLLPFATPALSCLKCLSFSKKGEGLEYTSILKKKLKR